MGWRKVGTAFIASAFGLICLLALHPAFAAAGLTAEATQGQQLADSVTSGQRQCSDLSTDDFELVGEYAMDQFIGDSGAHQAMNDQMARMMGPQGEIAMHVALGHRYSGCPGGPTAGWTMPMAGMMSRYGQGPGYGGGPGMMGGTEYGPMMDGGDYNGEGRWGQPDGHDDASAWAIAGVAVGGAIVGALLVLLGMRLRPNSTA